MPKIAIPIASDFLTGAILTLVLPLGVLIWSRSGTWCCGAAARANADARGTRSRRGRGTAHRHTSSYSAASLGTSWAISLGSNVAG